MQENLLRLGLRAQLKSASLLTGQLYVALDFFPDAPKAKLDIVALFNVLRIPFTAFTAKGAPVTDKKAMEGAAGRHPLTAA